MLIFSRFKSTCGCTSTHLILYLVSLTLVFKHVIVPPRYIFIISSYMNIRTLPRSAFQAISRATLRSKTRMMITAILILALIGIAIFAFNTSKTPEATKAEAQLRAVTLQSVAALTNGGSDLSIVGTVKSEAEATIRTESGGQVTRVYRELGDTVAAGSIIAEMENASQRAAVLQAQGGVEAAEANLAKVGKGARPEQIAILQSATVSAHNGAVNALLSAYAAIDDSVHYTADVMFSNPDTYIPSLTLTVTDSQLPVDLEATRFVLTSIIARERARSNTLKSTESSASLHAEIAQTQDDVRTARVFFDNLIAALGKSVTTSSISTSDIAAYKASASAARGTLTAALSSLSAADSGMTAADENLAIGTVGGTSEDIAAARAGVTQAQGGLAAARAALEKTIVRAPISGTINMLTLTRGNFEQPGTPVVTIANNGSLEVTAYVTEEDARRIAIGDTVTLGETSTGIVTRVAPALDPSTKKIEVTIALPKTSELTNGQSVIVHFGTQTRTASDIKEMIIPLAAIKIEVDSTNVFTVDENSTLVAHPITMGTLLGDRVVVRSGLTPTDSIVTDARGLKAGMKISVQ